MKKKIVIIEDSRKDYLRIKNLLEDRGFSVLPESFDEMGKAMDPNTTDELEIFVLTLLKKNYEDIGLVLCDINFDFIDIQGGNGIVETIRNSRDFTPSYWSIIVPIFAITRFSERQQSILNAGADLSYTKDTIFNYPDSFRIKIDSAIRDFKKHLKYNYPPDLVPSIFEFRRSHREQKIAFIITSFAEKQMAIANDITDYLEKEFNIYCHIADEPCEQNSEDLWHDIEIALLGCDFGIIILSDDLLSNNNERKKKNQVNPNVCFEWGYLKGMQKKVCFLNAETIPHQDLPSDIIHKRYISLKNERWKEEFANWINKRIFRTNN